MPAARPAKVARVIARLNVGGPALNVALLSAGLPPKGFPTTLYAGTPSPVEGDMSDYARSLGVQPVIVPRLGREISLVSDAIVIWQLWRLFRRERPVIVHTHTAKAGFVGRIAARLARVPLVIHTFHGHVLKGYFGPVKTRLFLALERFLGRRSDAVITVSPGLRRELIDMRIAPPERVHVIRLGFDLSSFEDPPRGRFRERHRIPADAPLVGIVARLAPVKNHALFMDAARIVADRVPNARFVLVGDGELRADLEARAADLGLADRTYFTGWHSPMNEVYADLDVCVISSVNEGTPVTLIEAMATGTPVVATAVGGIPDLVEDEVTGRLVAPGDPDALATAIEAALGTARTAEAATRTMAARSRESVAHTYAAERLVRDTAALYDRLLVEKGL
jgi:glycosyltransferase involved in cell wall biosynthesis